MFSYLFQIVSLLLYITSRNVEKVEGALTIFKAQFYLINLSHLDFGSTAFIFLRGLALLIWKPEKNVVNQGHVDSKWQTMKKFTPNNKYTLMRCCRGSEKLSTNKWARLWIDQEIPEQWRKCTSKKRKLSLLKNFFGRNCFPFLTRLFHWLHMLAEKLSPQLESVNRRQRRKKKE